MKRIVFLLLFLPLVGSVVFGQQDAQYSQYMFNGLVLNPAYAGSRDAISTTLLVRKQWVGLEGSPLSASLSMHAPSRNERHGFGGFVVNDRLGITNMLSIYGTYAYRIPMAGGNLAFGLQGGIQNYFNDWNDVVILEEDNALPVINQSLWLPMFGPGIYFSTPRYYFGASLPNLLKNKYNRTTALDPAHQVRHVFATGGALFEITNSLDLKPSILFKFAEGAPVEFDLNIAILIKKALNIGVSYRTGDAVIGMIEFFTKKGVVFGYAYDYTLTKLNQVNSGSHEVMVGYDFGFKKSKIVTPRYF